MTARVTFYDIAPEARHALVVKLAQAAWQKQKGLLIRCDAREAEALDKHLWVFRDEAFLPHEVCDDPARLIDAEARIVLTTRDVRVIAADVLLQLAPADLEFARAFDTVIDVVDHGDAALLDASRARFKAWSDSGLRPDLKKTI